MPGWFSAAVFETMRSLHLFKSNRTCWQVAPQQRGWEVTDSTALQTSTRRMEVAGARREPCLLNDRRSANVGLGPDGKQDRTDLGMQGHETLAGNGIVTVRAGSTAGVEGWITYRLCPRACGDGEVSRS